MNLMSRLLVAWLLSCVMSTHVRADVFDDHRKLMLAAIQANNVPRVKALLNTPYVVVDEKLPNSATYLIEASSIFRFEIVQLLLGAGASSTLTYNGSEPLVFAALNGRATGSPEQTETVRVLLAAGGNPNAKSAQYVRDATILQNMALSCNSPDVVRLLRSGGGSVNSLGVGGVTAGLSALHLLAYGPSGSSIPAPCVATARALVDPGYGPVDFSQLSSDGVTAISLVAAACQGPSRNPSTKAAYAAVRSDIVNLFLASGSAPVSALPAGFQCRRGLG